MEGFEHVGETERHVERSRAKGGRVRWIGVAAGVAVLVFLVGSSFPASPDLVPVGVQLPLLFLVSALEAVAFGFGVAFLAFGWATVRRVFAPSRGLAGGVFGSLGWLLLAPWIHDSVHLMTGHGLDAVIALNYVFHFGIVPFVAFVVYALLRLSPDVLWKGEEGAP